jgi:arylsulfatase A-like enzyme
MKKQPNVLFIMSDQHNANCLGGSGRPDVRTPNLDKLASEGVRFTHAYCNNPICAPSRVTFHTGQYCHTHRMLGNRVFGFNKETRETLGKQFKRAGYQTGITGKSHMVKAWNEEAYDYIRYCDLCDADADNVMSNHYYKYLHGLGLADHYEDGSLPKGRCNQFLYGTAKLPLEHTNELWTGMMSRTFIEERDPGKPFFLHMSFERPHPNFLISEEVKDMYDPEKINLPDSIIDAYEHKFASKPELFREQIKRRNPSRDELKVILAHYYTLITIIDNEIGSVIDLLREQGELDNTVIIYTADHGDFAGEHGLVMKNVGIYESIHRIPFLLKYPGGPQGAVNDAIIESVDLYPTLCELAGVPVPEEVDGVSLLPVVEGKSPGKEYAICEWDRFTDDDRMVNAIRTRRYRLTYYDSENGGELYDHETDPGEIHNLWDHPDYREIRFELLMKLFDQVSSYEKNTSFMKDIKIAAELESTETFMIHKHAKTWSEVQELKKSGAH